ncbi:hypothetical protein [Gymnodinialimonas ulvae]|uniref:hypothetical protein n=1 Tax=Gymnodinialimonas ulvae TaxID=3126504 RepID=UPI0030ADE863
MKLIDPTHPFYKPAWRRYLIVIVCFAWATFEMSQGNSIWAYLFAGVGGFLAYHLIFAFPKEPPDGEAD